MVIRQSGVQFRLYNLSITSTIIDRIGQQEVLLPINHNCYNSQKQSFHLETNA